MKIDKVRVAKKVEGVELEYALNSVPSRTVIKGCEKFIGYKVNSLEFVKVFTKLTKDNNKANSLLLQCSCGAYSEISKGSAKVGSNLNCSCALDKQVERVKQTFNTKFKESEENSKFCSYCDSWRPRDYFTSSKDYCDNCMYVSTNKVKVGLSFEDIMSAWEPSTHKPCTKKLPYLRGNSGKGYTVGGFTYIDSDKYDEYSKVHWIKVKNYVKCSWSKANLIRVGRPEDYKGSVCSKENEFLHKKVLRLSKDCTVMGDHISGITLDNRSSNLRAADRKLNSRNTRKRRSKTSSIYKGVSIMKNHKKPWKSTHCHNGKSIHIGSNSTEEGAARLYDTHLRGLGLEGSLFNFPKEGEDSVFR